jgi:hypothetical protein
VRTTVRFGDCAVLPCVDAGLSARRQVHAVVQRWFGLLEGCCAPYCDTTDPTAHDDCSALGDEWVCVPWFEPGTAPPDYENVGVCGSA